MRRLGSFRAYSVLGAANRFGYLSQRLNGLSMIVEEDNDFPPPPKEEDKERYAEFKANVQKIIDHEKVMADIYGPTRRSPDLSGLDPSSDYDCFWG